MTVDGAKRQWVPFDALPHELQQEARAETSRVRRHPDSRSRVVWLGLCLVLGMAGLAGGWQLADVVVSQPFSDPLRLIPLFGGGALFGVWLGKTLQRSQRVERGQTLLLGPTSLIIVDDVAVEVLPAERLSVDRDAVWFGRDRVERISGERDPWVAELAKRITRADSARARDDDPWRQFATISGRDGRPRPSVVRLGLGMMIGLGLAALIEAGRGENPGAVAEWKGAAADIQALETSLPEAIDRHIEARFGGARRALDSADQATDLAGVMLLRDSRPLPAELDERVVARFAELAARDLDRADSIRGSTQVLLAIATTNGVDADLEGRARELFAAHAADDAAATPHWEERAELAEIAAAFGDAELEGQLIELVTEAGKQALAVTDNGRMVTRMLRVADSLGAGELRSEASAWIARTSRQSIERARTAAMADATLEELTGLPVEQAHRSAVEEHAVGVMRQRLESARDSGELAARAEEWHAALHPALRRAFPELLGVRARALAERARSASELEPLLALRMLAAGDRSQVERRFLELARRPALRGSRPDARGFLRLVDPSDPDVEGVARALDRACQQAYGIEARDGAPAPARTRIAFFAGLLVDVCTDPDGLLEYEVDTMGGRAGTLLGVRDVSAQATALLRSALQELAELAGAPLEIELRRVTGGGRISVAIRPTSEWRPSKQHGAAVRDCVATFTRPGGAEPSSAEIEGLCVDREPP